MAENAKWAVGQIRCASMIETTAFKGDLHMQPPNTKFPLGIGLRKLG